MRRIVVPLGLLVLCSLFAVADKKDDFKKAASVNGPSCDLIPYSNMNSNCRDAYSKQREYCTGDRERGCDDLKKDDPQDREIAKERRDNAAQCIENRKYVRKKFDDAVDELKRESNDPDPEIQTLSKTLIEKINQSIEDHKQALDQTERRRDKCDKKYNGND
jgi:vacuolar-type H+-ATPase subunit I/STV1